MNQEQVLKRYYKEFFLSMGAYVVVLIASITLLDRMEILPTLRIMTTLAPIVPIAFVIIAIMRIIRDSDELQQWVYLLATSFSALLTGFVTFTYGFLENIGFPKFPTIWVLPMMFGLWGFSLGYFWKKYQ